MLHTPVMRFEPFRRVGADRLIRHHERNLWQPIGASRNDARRCVWALRRSRRLQGGTGRPLTLSREAGRWSPRPERSRAAQNGRCVPGARGRECTASGHPRGDSGRVGTRSAPTGEGPGMRAAAGTARGSWAGLWARPMVYIPGGWWTASACPVPHAIRRPGCVAQLGRLRWPALAHFVDLWVPRPPCPNRREARLSRPCPRRGGVVALWRTRWAGGRGRAHSHGGVGCAACAQPVDL